MSSSHQACPDDRLKSSKYDWYYSRPLSVGTAHHAAAEKQKPVGCNATRKLSLHCGSCSRSLGNTELDHLCGQNSNAYMYFS